MVDTVVIVGAGQCGASAAETLRGVGFDGRIVLVGDEPEPPYERPPLSKAFLTGAQDAAELSVHPRSWYADAGVELCTGVSVTGLDCGSRVALLSDGSRLGFDRLLLATGGRPRLLPGTISMERVRYLRTLADAASLRSSLAAASHVVVVGAGFIGAEVAASARSRGVSVTLLEVLDVPLARVLGPEVGAAYADLHRAHGVRLLTGEGLASVQESANGSVRVRTTRDRDLDCDLVVVGVGIEPRVELAAAAGLAVSNGVVVDEYCRTGVPFVYAAGDVANHLHPLSGTHIRVEHYDNAIRQGAAAARNMLGGEVPYDEPHWFWSDQYDTNLQYVGHCPRWDRVVVRGSLADASFSAFYLADSVLQAALAVNRPKDVLRARKLIRSRAPVDPVLLADENTDLRAVIAKGSRNDR